MASLARNAGSRLPWIAGVVAYGMAAAILGAGCTPKRVYAPGPRATSDPGPSEAGATDAARNPPGGAVGASRETRSPSRAARDGQPRSGAPRGGKSGAPAARAGAPQVSPGGREVAERGADAAGIAERFVGSPYEAGGISRDGFDCSGFVRWVYSQQGIDLPRTADAQADFGASIATSQLLPGDLIFFRARGNSGVSHVGIYVGGGRFVHAPKKGQFVRIDSLDDRAWRSRFAGARRPATAALRGK